MPVPAVAPPEARAETAETAEEQQKQQARAAVARRYVLQACAAALLPHRRALQGCHRWVAFGKDGVDLISYPRLKKGKIKGLQSCSSPHICPVCAPKIAERRVRLDLTPGLARARALGLGLLVLTSTLRHALRDDFAANIDGLLLARKKARTGGRWTRLCKKYGYLGCIRAFECTYGRSGFHPHFHDLVVFRAPLSAVQQARFELEMKAIWADAIGKAGLSPVTAAHGLHVSDAHAAIEEYVQKQIRLGTPAADVKRPRWDLPQELAKQPVKKGRTVDGVKGHSLMELLAIAADGELVPGAPTPDRAAAVFREYDAALTSRGVRQLYWSPGLKALLGVKDLSDAQIEALDEEEKDAQLFAHLENAEIAALIADDRRAALTSALAENDLALVRAIIAPYQRAPATQTTLPDPFWEDGLTWTNPATGRTLPLPPYVVLDAAPFDPNRPAVETPAPCLVDWGADDRDLLPPVGLWRDPLTERHNIPAAWSRRLREWNGDGQPVYYFEETRRERRESEIPHGPLQGILAGVWVAAGGAGVLAGRVASSDGLGRTEGTETLTDRSGAEVVKQLSPGAWTRPGDRAVWRFLAILSAIAPNLATNLATESPQERDADLSLEVC